MGSRDDHADNGNQGQLLSHSEESPKHENQLNENLAKEKLNQFFRSFTSAVSPLLLLDYDGTLAPFRVDRFKARPWTGVSELLTCIHEQTRTRMVVVTGRPAAEVLRLLAIEPAPEVWGLHGAERLCPDGRHEVEPLPPAILATLGELRAQLRQQITGGLLEEKPNSVAMHWRGVAPQKAAEIEAKTRALFEPLAQTDGLTLLEFEAGLELRAGRDKGRAVEFLLRESGDARQNPAAFLGDDVTDEAAFRAIKGQGLGVLVKPKYRDTAADLWLRPPDELREFLARWLAAGRADRPDPIRQ